MKITNAEDFKIKTVPRKMLMEWILRVLRDVEPESEGQISKAANDKIEQVMKGEHVSDYDLELIRRQTYRGKPGGWANLATAVVSRMLIDIHHPNMMRNNDDELIPFNAAKARRGVKTWDDYIAYNFNYALDFAITAKVNDLFGDHIPVKNQPNQNPKQYRLSIEARYIGWLNEMIKK